MCSCLCVLPRETSFHNTHVVSCWAEAARPFVCNINDRRALIELNKTKYLHNYCARTQVKCASGLWAVHSSMCVVSRETKLNLIHTRSESVRCTIHYIMCSQSGATLIDAHSKCVRVLNCRLVVIAIYGWEIRMHREHRFRLKLINRLFTANSSNVDNPSVYCVNVFLCVRTKNANKKTYKFSSRTTYVHQCSLTIYAHLLCNYFASSLCIRNSCWIHFARLFSKQSG